MSGESLGALLQSLELGPAFQLAPGQEDGEGWLAEQIILPASPALGDGRFETTELLNRAAGTSGLSDVEALRRWLAVNDSGWRLMSDQNHSFTVPGCAQTVVIQARVALRRIGGAVSTTVSVRWVSGDLQNATTNASNLESTLLFNQGDQTYPLFFSSAQPGFSNAASRGAGYPTPTSVFTTVWGVSPAVFRIALNTAHLAKLWMQQGVWYDDDLTLLYYNDAPMPPVIPGLPCNPLRNMEPL